MSELVKMKGFAFHKLYDDFVKRALGGSVSCESIGYSPVQGHGCCLGQPRAKTFCSLIMLTFLVPEGCDLGIVKYASKKCMFLRKYVLLRVYIFSSIAVNQ